ncbi:hypothetical protein VC273_18395 [Xanthomonas nasturtii]|uniref:hypothetical protein n=1 Tax=Xanthomonas TaxID=338 RepID=UPI002B22FF7A|nr:hypothetical protein [Xanthomonas nasturtii]MEA9557792.1 hypothetical protein [Xanthomonas nasturtii]
MDRAEDVSGCLGVSIRNGAVLLEFGKEVFDQVPAQAALLQRAREITHGTGERDCQSRSFAHAPMLEAQLLIKELGAQEARVLVLEASLGLKPPLSDSNDPDKN